MQQKDVSTPSLILSLIPVLVTGGGGIARQLNQKISSSHLRRTVATRFLSGNAPVTCRRQVNRQTPAIGGSEGPSEKNFALIAGKIRAHAIRTSVKRHGVHPFIPTTKSHAPVVPKVDSGAELPPRSSPPA